MTFFISHIHEELRRALRTRRGATHRPEDVPRGTHKSYPRMPQVVLPPPRVIEQTLTSVLTARRSAFTFAHDSFLSLNEWGTLLGNALAPRPENVSRNYPSGGALFPIETYVLAESFEKDKAAYHYNPSKHALERLFDVPASTDVRDFLVVNIELNPTALIVFTSVWQRSSAKYGDFTYTPALLEAGHMSENILLSAAGLGLAARPLVGFNDARISELLDLDGDAEQPVLSIALGKPVKSAAAATGDIES